MRQALSTSRLQTVLSCSRVCVSRTLAGWWTMIKQRLDKKLSIFMSILSDLGQHCLTVVHIFSRLSDSRLIFVWIPSMSINCLFRSCICPSVDVYLLSTLSVKRLRYVRNCLISIVRILSEHYDTTLSSFLSESSPLFVHLLSAACPLACFYILSIICPYYVRSCL